MEALRLAGEDPRNQAQEKRDAIRLMRLTHKEVDIFDPIDLRRNTYKLLSRVREPSTEERKSLEEKGFSFFSIEEKTLTQVVVEHPDLFLKCELEYLNGLYSPNLRYAPVAMEVAFNTNQLYIPGSFDQTQQKQLEMTEEYSKANLEKEFSDAKALMFPATVVVQADVACKEKIGEALFGKGFVRVLDRTADSRVVSIGRGRPEHQHYFDTSAADNSDGKVGVGVPLAVVFIRNR